MFTDYLTTPLGLIEIKATAQGVCQTIFCGEEQKVISNVNNITQACQKQLKEYFAGTRKTFNLPMDTQGTPFQQSVWHCLTDIPFGEVRSYGGIAKALNNPKASQAVGGANGRNPISIIVPCHRVIGGNGSLTGYAGGIERKLWLLKHEGVNIELFPEYAELGLSGSKTLNTLVKNVKQKRQNKTQFLR